MALDPEVAAFLESQRALPARGSMSVAETREFMRLRISLAGPPVQIHRVENRAIAGVPCRVYTPSEDGNLPVVVFFHGGRFFSGDLDPHDPLCRELSAQSGCELVAVDYRLAPEHKFPAAVEDALAVVRALKGRFAVAGDSAGGNLAAIAAREAGVACQILLYPMLDATCSMPSYSEFAEGCGLGAEDMKRGYREYLPPGDADLNDPQLSPLLSHDFASLPSAFILTAEYDTLRDEAEAYARRLESAGVPVTLARYDGMIHGFLQLGSVVRAAHDAIAEAADYLRAVFDLPFRMLVTDVLDLHSVPPKDVKAVVEEYLEEARMRGFKALRIIHGRGIGVQRETVRAVLARTPFVESFHDAPESAGGWGATVIDLRG
jgi:acetyl esterase